MNPRLRASVRLSWALVRRSRTRSALIALLVAVPVCAGVFVATMFRTAQLSPAQAASRYLGQADAIAQVTPWHALDPRTAAIGIGPKPSGDQVKTLEAPNNNLRDPATLDLTPLLPEGAHAIRLGWQHTTSVSSGSRTTQAPATFADLRDPVLRGVYQIKSGSAPRTSSDVAVTTALADRLHLHTGSSISVDDKPFTVTAVVREPSALDSREVLAPDATLSWLGHFSARGGDLNWLITFPHHRAPDLHDQLAHDGVIYETRSEWEHPSASIRARMWRQAPADVQDVLVRVSIAVVGGIEILLLAGTAFAVGARRQVAQLGILRAVGGDQTDVRRAVLGQAFLLGFGGAMFGALAGVLTVPLTGSIVEGITARALGPLDVPIPTVLLAVMAGTVAALLAAAWPARYASRLPVLDMLRQQFPTSDGAARVPRWAIAGSVLGMACIATSAVELHNSPRRLIGATGDITGGMTNLYGPQSHQTMWIVLLAIGAALTLAGLARLCPALLERVGQLAPRLPFTVRLAARDAGRQRHRTGPAAAAIAAVIAGAVLVLFIASSTSIRDRRAYIPKIPEGTVSVQATRTSIARIAEYTDTLAAAMHARAAGTSSHVIGKSLMDYLTVQTPRCEGDGIFPCHGASLGAVDSGWLDAVVGRHVPAAVAMLARGGAVVLQPNIARNGRVVLATQTLSNGNSGTLITTPVAVLPAVTLPPIPKTQSVPAVVVSSATATAHHWLTEPQLGIIRPPQPPTPSQLDQLTHSLGDRADLYAERGYQPRYGPLVLALIAAAALVLFAGTGITVALTLAESRNDMAILRAVGASPHRRRLHAMTQALIVGIIGTALGLTLGTTIGLALQIGSIDYPFSVPLRWLAATAISGLALAAMLSAGLTRSRTPLPRRTA